MIDVVKKKSDSGVNYESVQGSEQLRREIAKWSIVMEGKLQKMTW